MARLGEEALRIGANAVVGMRFDSRDCGEMWMEICAYGTAVIVAPKVPDVMPHDQPLIAAGPPRPASRCPRGIAKAAAPNLPAPQPAATDAGTGDASDRAPRHRHHTGPAAAGATDEAPGRRASDRQW